jgi:hypothetical protein
MAKLKTDDRGNPDNQAFFAFSGERKQPLGYGTHVCATQFRTTHDRNAVARFDRVKYVGDIQRDAARNHMTAAAQKFGAGLKETIRDERGGN